MESNENTELCLKWHNFEENFMSHFGHLKDEEEFVDVTLSCGGRHIRAHKVVLSASSPYLKALFKENPCKHPVVVLDCIQYSQLEALLTFVYTGQVNVDESDLQAFLDSAALLQIRGLSDVPQVVTKKEECHNRNSCNSGVKRTAPAAPEFNPTPPKRQIPRRISRPSSEQEFPSPEIKTEDLEAETQRKVDPSNPLPDSQERAEWTSEIDSNADGRRRHSLDPRPCHVCGRVYSNLSNLRQHLRLIHNPTLVTCHLCSKTFKTDLYLRRHLISYHDMVADELGGGANNAWRGANTVPIQTPLRRPSAPCISPNTTDPFSVPGH